MNKVLENQIDLGRGIVIGGGARQIVAGPCAVENEGQMLEIAEALWDMDIRILRASIFKPRTNLRTFQGLGRTNPSEAIRILKLIKNKFPEMLLATEVMSKQDVDLVVGLKLADIVWIGSRNGQNEELLKTVRNINLPVILKRGHWMSIDEYLGAAEYITGDVDESEKDIVGFSGPGNKRVILCLRGTSGSELCECHGINLRNVPDHNDALILKEKTGLPVIFDPSHGTGNQCCVPAYSKKGIESGADGLLIDVHPNPSLALVDGRQALLPHQFQQLISELNLQESIAVVRS